MTRRPHRDVEELIASQEKRGGIQVSKLAAGTRLTVTTVNSVYECKCFGGRQMAVSGGSTRNGHRFPQPVHAYLHGSTWGGSAIKDDWIGQGMRMELWVPPDGVYVTSSVQNVIVSAPDGSWSYSLDWDTSDSQV